MIDIPSELYLHIFIKGRDDLDEWMVDVVGHTVEKWSICLLFLRLHEYEGEGLIRSIFSSEWSFLSPCPPQFRVCFWEESFERVESHLVCLEYVKLCFSSQKSERKRERGSKKYDTLHAHLSLSFYLLLLSPFFLITYYSSPFFFVSLTASFGLYLLAFF